jgi:hypothetical protein
MVFSPESAQFRLSSLYGIQSANVVADTVALFQRLSVDDQLALLWFIYTETGRSITPAAPGAARLQLAEGLLAEIRQMSHEQQLKVMRDLAARVGTPITRSYGVLSANTKLAFWYQLAEWMTEGTVIPMPVGYNMSRDAEKVFEVIKQLDMSQQITVLRNVVVNMGVDPLG